MKTIGLPISLKENENRRALVLEDIKNLKCVSNVYVETGYGKILGVCDDEFEKIGCHVCSRKEVLTKDIICDPKVGDAEYLDTLENQIIFGWVHATQNKEIADTLINRKLTAYAWEKMFEGNKHVFWRNNELAGEAAVIHAYQLFGKMPYETSVAVIGKGNTARGAVKILSMLGAKITQYDRTGEQRLRDEIGNYDVIVNCILWDVMRKDHIIYRKNIKDMKKDSMIIDVSCDRNGGIETCVPTSFENPTYVVDGVLHYAVDHTPSLFYKTFSYDCSKIVSKYIDALSLGEQNEVLENCLIIKDGVIVDKEIIDYQKR